MWSIWLQSVVWWSTDDAKKRKLYADRGMSTVRANVIVLPVMLHQRGTNDEVHDSANVHYVFVFYLGDSHYV